MKTKLLLFAFCFVLINNTFAINKAKENKVSFNPPIIPTLIQVCDNDGAPNDGFTEFNIDYYVGNISGYAINYFSDVTHTTSISSPYTNINQWNQTIYYTITDGVAYTASGTITLAVTPVPNPRVNPPVITVCDDNLNDGYAIVDVTQNASYILNGETHAQLLYYTNMADAEQGGTASAGYISTPNAANVNGDVYVRVQWDPNYYSNFISSDGQPCAVIVVQPIVVNPTPVLPLALSPLTECDVIGNTNDGCTYFDLTQISAQLLPLQPQPASNYVISYYLNQTDAQTYPHGQNQLLAPNHYFACNGTILWVRIEDINTGCATIMSFNLVVETPTSLQIADVVAQNSYVLPTLPQNYNYYTSPNLANIIPAGTVITATQTIYIQGSDPNSGCVSLTNFNVYIISSNFYIVASSDVICVDFITGLTLNSVTLTANNVSNTSATYSYQWYENGVAIAGATNVNYVITNSFMNSISSDFSVLVTDTSTSNSVASNPVTIYQSSTAVAVGDGYYIVNNAGNQTITVTVQGFGSYEYSLDDGPRQTSNVFTNVALGTHIITVWDATSINSCNPLVIENIVVTNVATPAPTGNTEQFFTYGQTLADLVVNGQNIQWYASATGNKNTTSVAALPSNTLLQDNTTYYATQRVGGYESIDRLPVTAHLSLANASFQSEFAAIFPNPAHEILNVKSKESINKIEISNILGQKVLIQNTNSIEFTISLEKLPAQNYLVTLFSDSGKTQVIKIIKK